MSYKSIVDSNILDGLKKRIADDILQGIEKVYEKKDISSRRWIWELLQNAKDVPNQFDKVKIKVILDSNTLSFSHNGDPFTIKNLTNLIMQVSSKFEDEEDEEDDVTGKFGTGFLVTHLLSKSLTVDGVVYEDGETPMRFKINMNREATNVKELIINLDEALGKIVKLDNDEAFKSTPNYFNDRKEDDYDTSFSYDLKSEQALRWAKNGVKDLVNTLPLTLIFVNKVKEVLIIDNVNGSEFTFKLTSVDLEFGKLHTIRFNDKNAPENSTDFFFWTLKVEDDKLSATLQITSATDFSPATWNKNTPKIYRDFPLIGSEKFYLPMVANTHGFYPTEERSGLLIIDDESPKVIENKRLLIKSINLIRELITHLPKSAINKLYLLALSRIPDEVPEDWYKDEIQVPFRSFLLEQEIVHNQGDRKKLKDCKFPKAADHHETNKLFYDIVKPLLGIDILPKRDELNNWLKNILSDYDVWDCDLKYELENFIEDFEGKNISEIDLKDSSLSVYEWLNGFYSFLEKHDMRECMSDNEIIPNREDDLCQIKDLYINDGIHDVFLDAYRDIESDFSPHLIHADIQIPFTGHQSMTNKIIGEMINDKVKEDEFETNSDRIAIIYSLLRVFPTSEDSLRRRIFNAFSTYYKLDYSDKIIPGITEAFNFDPIQKRAVENLLHDIASHSEVAALGTYLGKNEDLTLKWLNSLIQDVKDYLEEYTIIPTRSGSLGDLIELYVNDGIHDVFLDIYKNLEEDYSPNLIHKQITLPITGHQSKTNSNIGEMINEIIKDESFVQIDDIADVIYSILRIFPSKEESFRRKVFKAFVDYFDTEKTELIIPGIQDDYNFHPILKRSIELLLQNISSNENIDNLQETINKDHDGTIIWLDNLLRIVSESDSYNYLLDDYNIIPNQNKLFIPKEDLFNDGIEDHPLPPKLLTILHDFDNEQDWSDVLLLDGIGLRLEQSKKIEELSSIIQKKAQGVFNAMTSDGADKEDVSTLMSLIKWTNKNRLLAEEHFKWILEKKPIINTMRIEDPAIQDAMYDLIDGDNDKIITLSKIAKKMSATQLEEIAVLTEEVGAENILAISKLAQNLSEEEIERLAEITAEIGADKLLEIAKDELEIRLDFKFKKQIGDNVEAIFKQAFQEINNKLIIFKSEGAYDFVVQNPNNGKKYFLELKSIGSSWNYIKMAQSQAKYASKDNENYALCVIRRPHSWYTMSDRRITPEYIIKNLKTVPTIGKMIQNAVVIAEDFKSKLLNIGTDEIGVEFKDANFHYKVPENKWENGESLNDLVEIIKKKLL